MPENGLRIFFDASVLVAAAKSPSGGSSKCLDICKGGKFQAITTSLVIDVEAESAIKSKFSYNELNRFNQEIIPSLKLVKSPRGKEIAEYTRLIYGKDAHVLAGAIKSKANVLLTLDRKHFKTFTLKSTKLPFAILTPKEFLQYFKIA